MLSTRLLLLELLIISANSVNSVSIVPKTVIHDESQLRREFAVMSVKVQDHQTMDAIQLDLVADGKSGLIIDLAADRRVLGKGWTTTRSVAETLSAFGRHEFGVESTTTSGTTLIYTLVKVITD
ncbi:hypothetical protein AAVH_24710 [Aphelenchoides avenae]|nr:hypothetical protein AAVH_24708 [Aphelenchus avenae]KAH7708038.1 hypothetical protein AAVH_24710 [Aphelenchus avenae]